MRKEKDRGFWISVLINMAFRYFWAFIFLLMIIIKIVFPEIYPAYLIFAPLVLWFLHGLVVTIILTGCIRIFEKIEKAIDKRKKTH